MVKLYVTLDEDNNPIWVTHEMPLQNCWGNTTGLDYDPPFNWYKFWFYLIVLADLIGFLLGGNW